MSKQCCACNKPYIYLHEPEDPLPPKHRDRKRRIKYDRDNICCAIDPTDPRLGGVMRECHQEELARFWLLINSINELRVFLFSGLPLYSIGQPWKSSFELKRES